MTATPIVATLREQLQRLGHDVEAPSCVQLERLRISDWMRRDLDTPCTVILASPAMFVGNNRAVLQIRWRKRDDITSWAHRGLAYVVFVDEGVGHYELVQAG